MDGNSRTGKSVKSSPPFWNVTTSVVTFDLTNYNLSGTTVFGMWNTTDEVSAPPGGSPVYRLELLVNNNPTAPTGLSLLGTGDNLGGAGVLGRRQMVLNAVTGEVSAGAIINGGAGIHTNALFWDSIPNLTTEIRVYGDLPFLAGNFSGDGVGYYFAELIPEPASGLLLFTGGLGLLASRRKRK